MPAPLLRSSDIQTTIRKPLSWPMLICFQNEWQVCYKAKGKLVGCPQLRIETSTSRLSADHFFLKIVDLIA